MIKSVTTLLNGLGCVLSSHQALDPFKMRGDSLVKKMYALRGSVYCTRIVSRQKIGVRVGEGSGSISTETITWIQ